MTEQTQKRALDAPERDWPISRNEILEVMADEGYSADGRKAWLKDVLTRVSQEQEENPEPDRKKLMDEIREILHGHVSDQTEADEKP